MQHTDHRGQRATPRWLVVLTGALIALVILLGGILAGLAIGSDTEIPHVERAPTQVLESPALAPTNTDASVPETKPGIAPGEQGQTTPTETADGPTPAATPEQAIAVPAGSASSTPLAPQATLVPEVVATPVASAKTTYRNETVGFEFEYPSEWPTANATEFEDRGTIILAGFAMNRSSGADNIVLPGPKIDIFWGPLPPDSSLLDQVLVQKDEWALSAKLGNPPTRIDSEEWIALPSGLTAVRFVATSGEEVPEADRSPLYIVVVNDYVIKMYGLGNYGPEVDEVAQSIRPIGP